MKPPKTLTPESQAILARAYQALRMEILSIEQPVPMEEWCYLLSLARPLERAHKRYVTPPEQESP